MRQCSAETDIERGQGSFCFLFQYGEKQALQDLEVCSASSHSPALIHRIKSGRVTTVTTPSSPDPGMAPMLSLEPLCSAAYFRASSSLIKNICAERSSWNNSAWDFFSIGTSPVFHRTIYSLSGVIKTVWVILLCVVNNIKIQTWKHWMCCVEVRDGIMCWCEKVPHFLTSWFCHT